MSQDPIMRGRRWQAFYDEDGGMRDMVDAIGRTYLERMAAVDPWNVEQLQILALAHKVTQQLDGMVKAIVGGAEVAQAAQEYTTRMQGLPASKRRRL